MHEARLDNALAALDILARADSNGFAAARGDGLSEDVAAWQRRYEEAKRAGKPLPTKPEPRNDDATTEVIQIGGKSYTIKQTGPKEWRYEAGINSMNGASLSSEMAKQQLIRAMQQRFG